MTPNTILWIYIVLLVLGGLMGFIKAGSKISLFMSLIFATLIVLFIFVPFHVWLFTGADLVLLVLLVFFGKRWAKSRKMMPAGMMVIATILALAARLIMASQAVA